MVRPRAEGFWVMVFLGFCNGDAAVPLNGSLYGFRYIDLCILVPGILL